MTTPGVSLPSLPAMGPGERKEEDEGVRARPPPTEPPHVVQDTVLLNALKVLKERTNALGPSGAARRDPPSLGFRPLSSFRSPTSSTLSSTHPF